MARVHVLAWQVGYRGIVPDGFLDALDVDLLGEEWTDNLRGWRFYEKQGWLPDGRTKTEEIGGKQLVELRYTTSL